MKRTPKRQLVRSFVLASGSALAFPVIFVYFTIFAHLLGPTDLGLLQFGQALAVVIATVSTLGLEFATPHLLASKEDAELRRATILAGGLLAVLFGGIFGGFLFLIAPAVVTYAFEVPEASIQTTVDVIRLLAAYSVFLCISYWIRGVFQGLRWFGLRSLFFVSLHFSLMAFAVAVAFTFAPGELPVSIAATAFVVSAGATILCAAPVLIQFLWIKIDTSSIKLVIRTARQLLSYGGRVFFAKVGWESYRWADLILVGVLLSATHVGVYAVAWMIANGITRVTTYMFEVIFPEVSRRNTPETARDISFAVTQGIRMSAYIIFPVGAFLILISPHLILTFYGPAFHEAILPLQILTLMMFSHIFAIASPLFMGLAKPGLLSRISFISAGLNILLNLIMIPTFGIVGAALASAITRWGQWSCSLFILRGFVDFPVPWGFLLKALTSTGIASIVAGILLSSYEPMGSIDTFIVLLLVGAVFAVVYAVGLVVFRSITAYDLRLLDALTDSRLGFLSRLIRYSERYR